MLLHLSRNCRRGWRPQSRERANGAENDGGTPTLKLGQRDNPSALSHGYQGGASASTLCQCQRIPNLALTRREFLQTPPAAKCSWEHPERCPLAPASPAWQQCPHAVLAPWLCPQPGSMPGKAMPTTLGCASILTDTVTQLSPGTGLGLGWGWMESPGIPGVFPSSLTACQDCCWTLHQDKLRVLPCPGL